MSQSISSRDVIKAAGGLLWRNNTQGKGTQLAVIHRGRYGDWTLPKGKLMDGETWEDAALREVREETGCEASLDAFAGTVSYMAEGTPKIVLFWNMQLTREGEFSSSEEVAEVQWLTVSEALQRLDHEGERHLLTTVSHFCPASQAESAPGRQLWWGRLRGRVRKVFAWFDRDRVWGRVGKVFATLDLDRLDSAIRIHHVEFDQLRADCRNAGVEDSTWADSVEALTREADQALRDQNAQRGWECLHAAERMELFGWAALSKAGNPLKVRAKVLWQETDKLSGWRRAAVEKLLASEGVLKDTLDVHEVYAAAKISQEHFSNVYRRLRELIRQLTIQSAAGLLILLVLFLTLVWSPVLPANRRTTEGPLFVLQVLLLGMLGASLSVLLSLRTGWSGTRIPMLLGNNWVNLTRLFVGALAALAAYLFLKSGLLQVVELTPALVLATALVSGFTERLVIRAIEAQARSG